MVEKAEVVEGAVPLEQPAPDPLPPGSGPSWSWWHCQLHEAQLPGSSAPRHSTVSLSTPPSHTPLFFALTPLFVLLFDHATSREPDNRRRDLGGAAQPAAVVSSGDVSSGEEEEAIAAAAVGPDPAAVTVPLLLLQ